MQTVSLELSKALFEKGLKIGTNFYWANTEDGIVLAEINLFIRPGSTSKLYEKQYGIFGKSGLTCSQRSIICPAPSTDELLAVMPCVIIQEQHQHCVLEIRTMFDEFCVCYYHPHFYHEENNKFLPEALGKMCLWLLENGYEWDEKEKMIRRKG